MRNDTAPPPSRQRAPTPRVQRQKDYKHMKLLN